jgi:Tol biopolymer transport system component/tRNA A-37 threonylcarbamoyl transferase component Bud32
MIGNRLGQYEITVKLGEGGMGEVWRARDTRLERAVAIKVLPAAFLEDHERLARFEREAKLLAQLQHPHVASIYGLEESDGVRAVVMELVEGEGLDERIARGPLPLDEALPIALQIAEALEAAHEKGIVHRDLKPANVKVTRDGTVKVLDFGLAKAWTSEDVSSDLATSPTITSRHTQAGMILGTAAYMSPEQARGKPADKRADIWAFGVVLFEMLGGKRLFEGDTVSDVVAAVLRGDLTWDHLPHDLPPAVRRVLGRCLERDPRRRLHDIGDVRILLEEASADQAVGHSPILSPPAATSPYLRALPWALFGLTLLALAGLGAWAWQHRSGTTRPPHFAFKQKTFTRQSIFNARFAPDGKAIVFSAAAEGHSPRLFIIRPDYPAPQPIGAEDTHLLSVSSKGELAVLSHAQWKYAYVFEGTLGRVPLGGGAPRDIMEGVRCADWSPDGSELAIIHSVDGKDQIEFPIGRALYESPSALTDIRVSPDGKRVAFFEHPVPFDDRGSVDVVDISGKRTVLASGFWGEEGLAWLPSGDALLLAAGRQDQTYQTREVDLAGHERVVMPTPGSVIVYDVSRGGTRLFARDDISSTIQVRPPGSTETRDFSWLDYSSRPVLSRDGRLLALTDEGATGGANYTTLMCGTDNPLFVQLGEGKALAFSPDGRWLAVAVPSSPPKLMLYPTGTGQQRRVDRGQLEGFGSCDWFADGRSLLVSANEPGKALRCFVMNLDGESARPVTPEGTENGLISPDGHWVCAQSLDGGYALYPPDGGPPRPLPFLTPEDAPIRWSPDGKALWVRSTGRIPARIVSVDVAGGRRTLIDTIGLNDPAGALNITSVSLADDPHVHVASIYRLVSRLFIAREER